MTKAFTGGLLPMTRDYEADAYPAVAAAGSGFVACYPMGRGFLTGVARASTATARGS